MVLLTECNNFIFISLSTLTIWSTCLLLMNLDCSFFGLLFGLIFHILGLCNLFIGMTRSPAIPLCRSSDGRRVFSARSFAGTSQAIRFLCISNSPVPLTLEWHPCFPLFRCSRVSSGAFCECSGLSCTLLSSWFVELCSSWHHPCSTSPRSSTEVDSTSRSSPR